MDTAPQSLALPAQPDKQVFEKRVKEALDAAFYTQLAPVGTSLGVLYILFAIGHRLLLPPGVSLIMTLIAGVSALILLSLSLILARRPIHPRYANPIGGFIAAIVLINSMAHLALLNAPEQTTNLLLLLVGAATCITSARWLLSIGGATFLGWAIIASTSAPSPAWLHFGIALGTASFLAMLVFRWRIDTLRNLEQIRTVDEQRAQMLEQTRQHLLEESTERQRHEEQIAFQARILAQVSDAVLAVNDQRRITYWNRAAEQLYGFRTDEALGREPEEIFHHALSGGVNDLTGTIKRSGVWRGEHIHLTRSGAAVPVSVSASTLFDENTRPIGWLAVIRDISEQQSARQMLQEQTRQQTAIAQLSRSALAGSSLPHLFDDAVTWAARVLDAEYAIALELADAGQSLMVRSSVGWKSQITPGAMMNIEQHMLCDYVLQSETPIIITNTGAEDRFQIPPMMYDHKIVSGACVVIRGAARPFGIFEVHTTHQRTFAAHDIHFLQSVADLLGVAISRARAEEALREAHDQLERRVMDRTSELARSNELLQLEISERRRAEKRYHDLFDDAPLQYVITLARPDGPIVADCNQAFLETLGYTRDEALGKPLANFYTARSAESMLSEGYQLALQQGLKEAERELLTRNGNIVPVLLRAIPEYGPDGAVTGTRAMFVDITERKRMEQALAAERASLTEHVASRTAELRAANAELARASRMKDEFLANMSHELRTPLTAILGLAEALQHPVYGTLTERQQVYLRMIEESGQHLLALINDILDLSKVEAGKIILEQQPVGIMDICQTSLRMIKQTAQAKQIKVSLTTDEHIDAVLADERRLKQILVNLLSNAVKFTPANGSVGLDVHCDAEHELVSFTVWDTGIGMEEEHLSRLFQPFVQLDSRLARQYEGTGLGLALVARLTELHGGRVEVHSVVGKGSRFTVVLPNHITEHPFALHAEPASISEPEPVEPSPLKIADSAYTILIAEDNDATGAMLTHYLNEHGFRVELVTTGADAVHRALEIHPNLILMDIQMPGMDGLEAIRRIRTTLSAKETPIIAITALAMAGDRERCIAAGADDYMSKPLRLNQLIQLARRYLPAQ